MIKAITTIKHTGLNTLSIHNENGELIATAWTVKDKKANPGFEYGISVFGGPAHGKIAYAIDFQDLNDKSVEIASLHN